MTELDSGLDRNHVSSGEDDKTSNHQNQSEQVVTSQGLTETVQGENTAPTVEVQAPKSMIRAPKPAVLAIKRDDWQRNPDMRAPYEY